MLSAGRRMLQSAVRSPGSRSLSRAFATALPDQARVVIVGGGIIGTSIAYHLGKQGWNDVVLLERDQLTSGTTWHAAGLCVTFGSLSETSCDMRKYSKELYRTLEQETGLSTGFMPVGFIELATNPDRLEEYRRVATFNRAMGIDVQEISPQQVQELMPLTRVDDVLAGFYVESDGRVNPIDATMSMAKGARMAGVQLVEGVSVKSIDDDGSKVTGVTTDDGHSIKADVVVNAAGMWARQLGEQSGVCIPNQAAEHYYLITDTMEGVDPHWPVVEDPSSYTYLRPEGDGMMVGLFEAEAAAWKVDSIPEHFSFDEIDPDWERMTPFLEAAMSRVPATMEVGLKKFFCGPESFTPDLGPIIGEAPELRNYFVAAGLNSIGILTGGGVGRVLANWIVNGKPDCDVTGITPERFQAYQANPAYRGERVVESLGMVYKCHYPTYAHKTARGAKRPAVYPKLVEANAYFKDVSGYESPDWYAPEGVAPEHGPYSWGRHHWFEYWAKEHKACREGVILMDMSFMSKFLVQGKDAGELLNYLSTANVDGACGEIVYTQWLDEDGKMQGDLTVTKLAEGKYQVVATDTQHRHTEAWMRRHMKDGADVTITDVTGAIAQLNIQGPKSRELMELVTNADMSNEGFPFRAAREIPIGFARVLCTRITYLGELGYELFIPSEHALQVYDVLNEAGKEVGMVHAGLKALSSLRIEKGYRDFGHDMDNTDSYLECGLGFTADYKKEGGFLGKDAVLEQKAGKLVNLKQRLCQVLLKDPEPMMYHGEVVLRDGECVGDIRAASYAHTLGGALGLSMIRAKKGQKFNKKYISEGEWEVEVAGTRYPAEVSLRPMYDPKNLQIKL